MLKNSKKIITAQILIIASLILAIQSVSWLSNQINNTANKYTTQYAVSLTK